MFPTKKKKKKKVDGDAVNKIQPFCSSALLLI